MTPLVLRRRTLQAPGGGAETGSSPCFLKDLSAQRPPALTDNGGDTQAQGASAIWLGRSGWVDLAVAMDGAERDDHSSGNENSSSRPP